MTYQVKAVMVMSLHNFWYEPRYVEDGKYTYCNVGVWAHEHPEVLGVFDNIHLFDGTLDVPYVGFEDDAPATVKAFDLGFTPDKLLEYFVNIYDDRFLAIPYSSKDRLEVNSLYAYANEKLKYLVELYNQEVMPRFLGIIKTLTYKYNPISNYDMLESYNWARKPDLQEFTFHDHQEDVYGGNKTTTVKVDNNAPITTNNYTTTYDDASKSRLANYSEQYGTTTTTESGGPTVSTERSYTMNTQGTDHQYHTLTRSGNIGVTTSQQMIETERQLWALDLVKDWFDGLTKYILLAI